MLKTIEDIFPVALLHSVSDDAGMKIGVCANLGAHTAELLTGVYLACKNKEGRPPVQLIWKEEQRSAAGGAGAASYLISVGAHAVIGHLSATTSLAASEIYDKKNVLFFATGTSHPELIRSAYRSVFRVCGRDDQQADTMIAFLQATKTSGRIALVAENIKYGRSLSKLLFNKSAMVAGEDFFLLPGNEEAQQELFCKLSRDFYGIVVYVGRFELGIDVVLAMKLRGYTGIFLMGDDCFIPRFKEAIRDAAPQVYVMKMKVAVNEQSAFDKLVNEYMDLRGEKPGAYFFTSFVAACLLLDAIEEAGSNVDDLCSVLKSRIWPTLLGPIQFDAAGEVEGIGWETVLSDSI